MVGGYLLMALCYAAFAVLWTDDRLLHAIAAALWTLFAVALLLKKWPPSVDGPTA